MLLTSIPRCFNILTRFNFIVRTNNIVKGLKGLKVWQMIRNVEILRTEWFSRFKNNEKCIDKILFLMR